MLRRLLSPMLGRRGFVREDKGAVLLEFAILAFPFFTLIFAILETAMYFLAGQILDAAVQDATRKIRTGQAQSTAGYNASSFRTAICDELWNMFDCSTGADAKLKIKVEVVPTFGDVTISDPIDPACKTSTDPDDCDYTLAESYDPGIGSDIVLVRAYYKWPVIITLPYFNMETQAGGTRMLSAVRVFRNEPF